MADESVKMKNEREQVKAGSKTFSFIKSATGSVTSYTLDALKALGFSAKGFVEEGNKFLKAFGYDNNGMKYRFELVHVKSKQFFPVWASTGLKEELEEMDSYKESKNGNPYLKVPEAQVAFYEVIDEDTKEVGLIVGRRGEVDDAIIL